jgi:hypothetical protein
VRYCVGSRTHFFGFLKEQHLREGRSVCIGSRTIGEESPFRLVAPSKSLKISPSVVGAI